MTDLRIEEEKVTDLRFEAHGDLVTVMYANMVVCQFPRIQEKRYMFPWTFCPSWLSWGIGGAYNNVASSERLTELVRNHFELSEMTPERFIRNRRKFVWEFGPRLARVIVSDGAKYDG